MINLAIGIAIGAAFAPFWVKAFNWAKTEATATYDKFKAGK